MLTIVRTGLVVLAAVLALGTSARAQSCVYDVSFQAYGTGCSSFTPLLPALDGEFDGTASCSLAIAYDVPPLCCNVYVVRQLLLVGLSPTSLPLPNGCTLLVDPKLILFLSPTAGTTVLKTTLPNTTALIGAAVYLQGVVDRFDTFALAHDLEFTAGLRLSFE